MQAFWSEYKAAHYHYATRLIHTIGTLIGIWFIASGVANKQYWVCGIGIFSAYALAWGAHYFIEHNSPLTLKNPVFSLLCDLYMASLILTRRNPI